MSMNERRNDRFVVLFHATFLEMITLLTVQSFAGPHVTVQLSATHTP